MKLKIIKFIFFCFGGKDEFLKLCFTDCEKMTIKMALDEDTRRTYYWCDRNRNYEEGNCFMEMYLRIRLEINLYTEI